MRAGGENVLLWADYRRWHDAARELWLQVTAPGQGTPQPDRVRVYTGADRRPGAKGRGIVRVRIVATTEQIWHGLHDRLLRTIRRHVADTASAEDILQDVFLKIHLRIGSLRDEERLEGWVYQIVRNAIVDHRRHQRPGGPLPEELVDPATADDDDGDSPARQLIPFIRETVAGLPEPYREALLLTEYGGLTQQQLAERVGISLSGAKSRVQRGRERLKQVLLDCCHVELDRRGGIIDYQGHCACCANGRCGADCAPGCGNG